MKERILGRVNGDFYELVKAGAILKRTPLIEAKACPKHAAAIQRNGWEAP